MQPMTNLTVLQVPAARWWRIEADLCLVGDFYPCMSLLTTTVAPLRLRALRTFQQSIMRIVRLYLCKIVSLMHFRTSEFFNCLIAWQH
eukprot:m.256196 g.256196  ORF g.256196 m.256196 type:complete len:88 (-) comp19628_c0_seq2:249-512(-)